MDDKTIQCSITLYSSKLVGTDGITNFRLEDSLQIFNLCCPSAYDLVTRSKTTKDHKQNKAQFSRHYLEHYIISVCA